MLIMPLRTALAHFMRQWERLRVVQLGLPALLLTGACLLAVYGNLYGGYPRVADPQMMNWYPPALLLRLTGAEWLWNPFVLSAGVLETFAPANADFFECFQTIRNKRRADHEESFGAGFS